MCIRDRNQVTDPFILEVRRERGIELTMENSRYQDIILSLIHI